MKEMEAFDTAHEANIRLPKDDGPLKGRPVQALTLKAVANSRIERISGYFKGDGTAETLRPVLRREGPIVLVGRSVPPASVFPSFIFFAHGPEYTRRVFTGFTLRPRGVFHETTLGAGGPTWGYEDELEASLHSIAKARPINGRGRGERPFVLVPAPS